jgi:ABC-type branched-subunit amino acid transport system substrate-binding protein
VVAVLTGCGSQLDPDQVAAANGGSTRQPPATGPAGAVASSSVSEVHVPSEGIATQGGVPGGGASSRGGDAAGHSGPSGHQGPTDGAGSATGGHTDQVGCDGFRDGPGVTDSEITIGNASDISGPLPGVFQSARDAVQAYVDYFNSTSDICGRKLRLVTYDDRTDAAADQQVYAEACDQVFAMVGSMSAFDSGGAAEAEGCGLPDLRAMSVTNERRACTTCYAASAGSAGQVANAVPAFVEKNYGAAAQHAGMVYLDAQSGAQDAEDNVDVLTARGMHFDVVEGIDVAEFNYEPYVQQLEDKGVQVVVFIGAYEQSIRLREAMAQLGYEPALYLRDASDYTPDFVSSGGDAVDGTVVYLGFQPFDEAPPGSEMGRYISWLHQVDPSAEPDFYGVYAWSAARLFVEKAAALGGRLSRASLLDAVAATRHWTADGLHAPEEVGTRDIGSACLRFLELSDSSWHPVGGSRYSCLGGSGG